MLKNGWKSSIKGAENPKMSTAFPMVTKLFQNILQLTQFCEILDQIVAICKEYYERIKALESEKFDMEKQITLLDTQVEETNIQVSNLRGKL